MATIHREGDLDLLSGKVAVIGYGSQGHAHALNLRDSGVDVVVGLREGSSSRATAEEDGLAVGTVAEAVRGAQLVAILLPDQVQPKVWEEEIAPNLEPDAAVLFAHGFNVHYGRIAPAPGHDVIMVAPKGPGHIVRAALHGGLRDARASSRSRRTRAATPATSRSPTAPGSAPAARACSRRRSWRRPRPTCSASRPCSAAASTELVRLGFETLVEAGYQPEIAYYECLHELKLIVDLIYEGGLAGMRYSISDTAEYGDLTRGQRVIDDHVRENMRRLLADIREGGFAREWIAGDGRRRAAPERAARAGRRRADRGGRQGAAGAHAPRAGGVA